MTTTAPKQRSSTAEQILDLAEMLIQTRGYSAFSYQDISDALGITKASIHYHFASKTDLGIAVVDRYVERFGAAFVAIAEDQSQPSMAMLDFYIEPYIGYAKTPDQVCLCGALAGEILALPPELRVARRPLLQGAPDVARPGFSSAGPRAENSRLPPRRARWLG